MKIKLINLMLIWLLAAVAVSCSKESNTSGKTPTDPVAAVFRADILTRAHDGVWDPGDSIGVAMLSEAGTEIINDVYNYQYFTAASEGLFEPRDAANIIYYPTDGSLVTFRAYYPFYPDMTNYMDIPIDVSDQSDLPDIDVMSADHLIGNSYRDPVVHLEFHHCLSKLIFLFDGDGDPGNDQIDLSNIILTVSGMRTQGVYNLLTERVVPDKNSVADFVIPARTDPEQRVGIVIPRGPYEGVSFRFEDPETGAYYTAYMSSELELESGKQYTFHISLNRTEVTITADIEDWVDGSEEWIEAQ